MGLSIDAACTITGYPTEITTASVVEHVITAVGDVRSDDQTITIETYIPVEPIPNIDNSPAIPLTTGSAVGLPISFNNDGGVPDTCVVTSGTPALADLGSRACRVSRHMRDPAFGSCHCPNRNLEPNHLYVESQKHFWNFRFFNSFNH